MDDCCETLAATAVVALVLIKGKQFPRVLDAEPCIGIGRVLGVELGACDGEHGFALVHECQARAPFFVVPFPVAPRPRADFEHMPVCRLRELLAEFPQSCEGFG